MKIAHQLAKHLRAGFTGGNWSDVNLKQLTLDITWREANTRVKGLNTITALTFHIGYFVEGVSQVLAGGELTIKDKFSFDHPTIHSQEEWEQLISQTLANVATFANQIEALSDEQIWGDFVDAKYGTWYANIQGIIEHSHYHLGQIAVLKKYLKS